MSFRSPCGYFCSWNYGSLKAVSTCPGPVFSTDLVPRRRHSYSNLAAFPEGHRQIIGLKFLVLLLKFQKTPRTTDPRPSSVADECQQTLPISFKHQKSLPLILFPNKLAVGASHVVEKVKSRPTHYPHTTQFCFEQNPDICETG